MNTQQLLSQSKSVSAKIAPTIDMGVLELYVKNLDVMRDFYEKKIGLEVIDEHSEYVTLGFHNNPVVNLVQSKSLQPAIPGSAGLYHLAILFESRSMLAKVLQEILAKTPQHYSGSADHLVSEAFYLNDPEGNGIELYFDKDEASWQWNESGIVMSSLPLNPLIYIEKYQTSDAGENKKIGHVHLKVGNIQEAKHFYQQLIGFAPTFQMPTALFLSNGTYHHHLGMNIWESHGAHKRTESLGLKSFEVIVPTMENLKNLEQRLLNEEFNFVKNEQHIEISDPWNNLIKVRMSSKN